MFLHICFQCVVGERNILVLRGKLPNSMMGGELILVCWKIYRPKILNLALLDKSMRTALKKADTTSIEAHSECTNTSQPEKLSDKRREFNKFRGKREDANEDNTGAIETEGRKDIHFKRNSACQVLAGIPRALDSLQLWLSQCHKVRNTHAARIVHVTEKM